MKLIRTLGTWGVALMLCVGAAVAQPAGQDFYDRARGTTPIMETTKPPVLGNAINDDVRRTRNYAQQPPVIPHRIDGYQIDKNYNKCMDCHSRANAEVSQAVPVSITHYQTRDGDMLGKVSTRRYFCVQCHVSQEAARPLVENTFEHVDAVLLKALQKQPGAKAPSNP